MVKFCIIKIYMFPMIISYYEIVIALLQASIVLIIMQLERILATKSAGYILVFCLKSK